jgi:KTSC domain
VTLGVDPTAAGQPGVPSVYRYFALPQLTYAGLMAAPSIGSYVNARIKPYYECAEV